MEAKIISGTIHWIISIRPGPVLPFFAGLTRSLQFGRGLLHDVASPLTNNAKE